MGFALFIMQHMSDHLIDNVADADSPVWRLQHQYFTDISTVARTLAMCTTGGKDWEEVWELIQPLGFPSTYAFLFYMMFFIFALMNILTGIFVDQAMQMSRPTVMEAFAEQRASEETEIRELRCLMELVDVDGTGQVTLDEFAAGLQNPRVAHALLRHGIDIKVPELYFQTLAAMAVQGGGVSQVQSIDIDDFVTRIIQMRGVSTSVDVHTPKLETTMLQANVRQLRAGQERILQGLCR